MNITATDLVSDLLDDPSYHIEFNGHLTNHVKHAVVALAGIGASERTIRRYHREYCELTPYGFPLEPARRSRMRIDKTNWKDHLGQRTSFGAYCDFFAEEVSRLGRTGAVAAYSGVLSRGWVGAFTHAAIHIGWALRAEHDWMLTEGLAYQTYSYVPCIPEGRAEKVVHHGPDAVTAARGVLEEYAGTPLRAKVTEILDEVTRRIDMHPELHRSGLQARVASVCDAGVEEFVARPDFIDATPVATVWSDLRRMVTLLYLANPGDFVVLHLITSLFALEAIAETIGESEQRDLQHQFWSGAWSILAAEQKMPPVEKYETLEALYRGRHDTGDSEQEWDLVRERAYLEAEEHNPKLVYVLLNWWRQDRLTLFRHAAAQFTATPDLPASFDAPPQLD